MSKKYLNKNVLDAAIERIEYAFDNFPKVYVSFSGGKDSTVMMHLVMKEAIKRQRRVGVLFVDLEGQYKLTIEHIQEIISKYTDNIDVYWTCLPMSLRNAVSQFEPKWVCWDPKRRDDWVRHPPDNAITDPSYFPFFREGMEFEEFVPQFGKWFSGGDLCACFVGIRTDESLNRYRTIKSQRKTMFDNKSYTTWIGDGVYNLYPIYDWKTKDIWIYLNKTQLPYNALYDRMMQAGMTIHQMRICQPYGDDQRKGLWLFQLVEPETWAKIVARVNGANQGALYSQETGNILGNIKITKPEGHTWESFANLLLNSMPSQTAEHYKNKIAVFIKWYADRGQDMKDDGPITKNNANWKRVCKALLRNDYWCKGLSFSQHKSTAYEKYQKLMKKRRESWGII